MSSQPHRAPRTWQSTVGKKIVMAITGLLLAGFLVAHLGGNLAFFVGSDAVNVYAHTLKQYTPLLNVMRTGLAVFFLFHIVTGLRVTGENRRARRKGKYAVYASKKGPSKLSVASRSMIMTGLVLLVFVPIHIQMFSRGAYYPTTVNGIPMRDLYTLVVEKFKNPLIAFGYAGVMLLLGMHLRHGIWSALQSLGVLNKRSLPVVYAIGTALGIILAGGFVVLPLYIYFLVPLP